MSSSHFHPTTPGGPEDGPGSAPPGSRGPIAWRRWLIALGILAVLVAVVSGVAGFILLRTDIPGLPSVQGLLEVHPPLAARLYCSDGSELARLFEENRVTIPVEDMPPYLLDAVVAVEDQKFWSHWGVDLFGILRALLVDLREGSIVQGGSTITQQLARTLFLNRELSITRKIKEALVAVRIERAFSKEEILALYLNQVNFGEGSYGVEVASENFLGKEAHDLTLGEAALLVGLVKNPEGYSPRRHLDRALQRRDVVLHLMASTGAITEEEANQAAAEPVTIVERERHYRMAPYFVERVRLELTERYGEDALYRGGLRVYTTLDPQLQEAAESAVEKGLAEREATLPAVDRRAIEAALPKGVALDSLRLQGALLAIEPATGFVRAMVGGRDFYQSPFNRAVQARRQPGSAFKLFVYAAALDRGYTPASLLLDEPLVVLTHDGTPYKPTNYSPGYAGRVPLREALAKSINIPAVNLLLEIGARDVIDHARRLGVRSPLAGYPSLALGSFETTLTEMTEAYAAVANGGVRAEPMLVERVEDRQGRVLEKNFPRLERALDPDVAWIMNDLLETVVNEGTGRGARRMGLEGPAAGKTGTTNEYTDTWFVGYIPGMAAGVWVGYDIKVTMGDRQSGAVVALPIWTDFMKAAHADLPEQPDLERPASLRTVMICPESGLEAGPLCPHPEEVLVPPSWKSEGVCPYHEKVVVESTPELPLPSWRGSD
jgi:penicillin-binding protein 1A